MTKVGHTSRTGMSIGARDSDGDDVKGDDL